MSSFVPFTTFNIVFALFDMSTYEQNVVVHHIGDKQVSLINPVATASTILHQSVYFYDQVGQLPISDHISSIITEIVGVTPKFVDNVYIEIKDEDINRMGGLCLQRYQNLPLEQGHYLYTLGCMLKQLATSPALLEYALACRVHNDVFSIPG